MSKLEGVLREYFQSGRSYKVILARLKEVHGITRSTSWLKRCLRALYLSRRPSHADYTPVRIVSNCIMRELRTSNACVGYRAMWHILKTKYKLIVKRETVMRLLKTLDSHGVANRRAHRLKRRKYLSKGPDFIWHIDGYDKLTPFGFCIHGCVDGFSRKILWLKAASTNNDPAVILHYFLKAILQRQGCPTVIRMDNGTENVLVGAVQYAMREGGEDNFAADKSFMYGVSTANIRVEAMWSHLRRHCTDWWISMFKSLAMDGFFMKDNLIHKWCLSVVFLPLLRAKLEEFVDYWNSHRIRETRRDCIGGVPSDLYEMPFYYGTTGYIKPLDPVVANEAAKLATQPPPSVPDDFYTCCCDVLREGLQLDLNKDVTEANAKSVYLFLIHAIVL